MSPLTAHLLCKLYEVIGQWLGVVGKVPRRLIIDTRDLLDTQRL